MSQQPPEDAIVGSQEAADRLGLKRDTVDEWCRQGKLDAVKGHNRWHGGWRIRLSSVERAAQAPPRRPLTIWPDASDRAMIDAIIADHAARGIALTSGGAISVALRALAVRPEDGTGAGTGSPPPGTVVSARHEPWAPSGVSSSASNDSEAAGLAGPTVSGLR